MRTEFATEPDICLEEVTDGFQDGRMIKGWMVFYKTRRPYPLLIGRYQTRHIEQAWSN